ncbi:MAG: hypothetical protein Q8L08_02515 [Candidatus Nanopelagicaceae bacterium]|nr:hypothetical protein [Candidatus Nanopelagicaceae bacterium]
MIAKRKNSKLLIGGESRVDFLPAEVRIKRHGKVVRRRFGFSIFLIILVMFGCTALVQAQAQQAHRNLAIEEANTKYLISEQQKYGEVAKAQNEIATIQAAQQVGTSTEINWQEYLTSVQGTLPSNVTIETINIDSATPFAPYTQATAPLQGSRIATLSFTALSPTLPKVPTWLIALTSLPGYSDASPGSVTRTESGSYSVNITMHINQEAFTNRFAGNAGISK